MVKRSQLFRGDRGVQTVKLESAKCKKGTLDMGKVELSHSAVGKGVLPRYIFVKM